MIIEHKIISNSFGKRVLTNKSTWIEPKNIVSIERKYVRLLDMNYTQLTTTDSRTYDVFDQACREALFNYQKQEASFFGKYSESLLSEVLVIMIFAGISIVGMHSVMEYSSVQNFYNKFLAEQQN